VTRARIGGRETGLLRNRRRGSAVRVDNLYNSNDNAHGARVSERPRGSAVEADPRHRTWRGSGSPSPSCMKTERLARIATSDAREDLAELVNEVAYGGARIILQRHGKDVAALVSLNDLERLGVRLTGKIPMWADVKRS